MTLIKHWSWLLVMILGLACVTVGVFLIVGGETAKSEVVNGFDLTRVKYYDPANITWEYKDVNSAEDIEDILDNIKEQRYFMENLLGYMLGER